MNIRTHIQQAIRDGLNAEIAVDKGRVGVLFHDEAEFIPFANLGYTKELGYYDTSLFPDVQSECDNDSCITIHPLEADWPGWVLMLDDGTPFLLGERWQVAEIAQALNHFLATGEHDPEVISDAHPNWGIPMTMSNAVDYIAGRGWPRHKAADALRRAAWEGRIPGATKNENGSRWIFSRRGLDEWLRTAKPYATA